ncbi:hypothetical protein LQ939_14135 [Pantoea alhagi]|nr:hypothetical protein [Pantoea alhagi]URQ59884.1 hypothetical protein LQ939_14135 [Pantoea alhagi]
MAIAAEAQATESFATRRSQAASALTASCSRLAVFEPLIETAEDAFRCVLGMAISIVPDYQRAILFGYTVGCGIHLFKTSQITVLIGAGIFFVMGVVNIYRVNIFFEVYLIEYVVTMPLPPSYFSFFSPGEMLNNYYYYMFRSMMDANNSGWVIQVVASSYKKQ